MKKALFLITFLISGELAFAQNTSGGKEAQVHKLIVESFDEIWSALDSNKIAEFYTKDFLLLENGAVWTNDSISNHFNSVLREKIIPKRVNTIKFIETKVVNGTAWVAYHNYAVWAIDKKIYGNAHWLESATAILTEDGWKLQMLHSTRIKE